MRPLSPLINSTAPSTWPEDQEEENSRRLLLAVVAGDASQVRQALASLSSAESAAHALRLAAGLGHADIASAIIRSKLPEEGDALDSALVEALKAKQVATVRQLLLEASRFTRAPALVQAICVAGDQGEFGVMDEILSAYRPPNKVLAGLFRFVVGKQKWPIAVHLYDSGDSWLYDRWISESSQERMDEYRALRHSSAIRLELDEVTNPIIGARPMLGRRV